MNLIFFTTCLFSFCLTHWTSYLHISPLCVCVCARLCPNLCNPMDCSLPGSSVYGILQARILEQIATASFRGLPNQGFKSASHAFPALVGRFFNTSTTWEALIIPFINTLNLENKLSTDDCMEVNHVFISHSSLSSFFKVNHFGTIQMLATIMLK